MLKQTILKSNTLNLIYAKTRDAKAMHIHVIYTSTYIYVFMYICSMLKLAMIRSGSGHVTQVCPPSDAFFHQTLMCVT